MTKKEREKTEAVNILKEWGLNDGTVVYAKVTQVSRSGMSRHVELFMVKGEDLVDISYWAARALQWGYADRFPRGIRVSGCGMDMLFHTVNALSYAMGYGALNQSHDDKTGLRYRAI